MARSSALLLSAASTRRSGLHRVEEMLRLADALGVARVPRWCAPQAQRARRACSGGALCGDPCRRRCSATSDGRDEGWRELAAALSRRGLQVRGDRRAGTGRARLSRRRACEAPTCARLDGQLTWHETRRADRRSAQVFVGPDTSVTHLAAATRRADRGAVRPDRSAPVGAVAGRRTDSAVGGGRHDPAARQCLAGAEPAALPAVPAGRLRPPPHEPQPLSR